MFYCSQSIKTQLEQIYFAHSKKEYAIFIILTQQPQFYIVHLVFNGIFPVTARFFPKILPG
ncbi:MAG: hypothetical protein CSA11_12365 [Chloroflexi bacterium]|nr:MAG: hypothetical protein CSA11_12365 [Chloroflexota bacterium]